MALSKTSLKQKIIKELQANGIVVDGDFAQAGNMAEAIANAIVDEFIENAKANVTSGCSAGEYSII
ncbi:hypothetical protein ABT56_12850 [Photobacterium aquae]|uniref:Uncharacterized protein n=1 Tax=Photobacterium aquae TaxID=1195763 RepID=A0A0J1GZU3_9GAMM|nr:hypothetical protein [Photobacterium aquae]KLV05085.1 hypothetical protein ABT56_12850 [Photobacterium aquae]